jgi:hypothetical protein
VKWFLHSLESCDMLQRTHDGQVTVHLSFNTVRRDRCGTKPFLVEKMTNLLNIGVVLLKIFMFSGLCFQYLRIKSGFFSESMSLL